MTVVTVVPCFIWGKAIKSHHCIWLFQMFQDSDLLCFAASSALTVVRWLRPWILKPCPRMSQELLDSWTFNTFQHTKHAAATARARQMKTESSCSFQGWVIFYSLLILYLFYFTFKIIQIHSSIHIYSHRITQVFTRAWGYFWFVVSVFSGYCAWVLDPMYQIAMAQQCSMLQGSEKRRIV